MKNNGDEWGRRVGWGKVLRIRDYSLDTNIIQGLFVHSSFVISILKFFSATVAWQDERNVGLSTDILLGASS